MIIPERVKCDKCGNASAILIKILNTKEQKKDDKKQIYLQDVVILAFECQECKNRFTKTIR